MLTLSSILAVWTSDDWVKVIGAISSVLIPAVTAAIVIALKAANTANAASIKADTATTAATNAQGTANATISAASAAQSTAGTANTTAGVANAKAELLTTAHNRNADDIRQLNADQTRLANQLPPTTPPAPKPPMQALT